MKVIGYFYKKQIITFSRKVIFHLNFFQCFSNFYSQIMRFDIFEKFGQCKTFEILEDRKIF